MSTKSISRSASGQEPGPSGRETFSLSRTAEFFSEEELTKQIGYPRHLWLPAIAKELVDNALDNCEEHGILPEVAVILSDDSLSVRDNGTGIPPDTVSAMLDFTKRVSSREAFRSPTRGAQGNAGKCVLGCPFVLNGSEGLVIVEANGVHHEIAVAFDSLSQEPVVDHKRVQMDRFRENGTDELPSILDDAGNGEKVHFGTFVQVRVNELPSILDDWDLYRFALFGHACATLNPHLTLALTLPDGTCHTWDRTSDAIKKWTAAELEPPAWYDSESFERLVGASIQNDRERGADRSLRDFLRQFAGLRRSAALKAVADDTGLQRAKLSALLNGNGLDHDNTAGLLAALQKHGTCPPAKKLGCIGRQHISAAFARAGEVADDIKYKKIVDECDGLPFVVEAAFAELVVGDEPIIVTGCNFTPSIDRPVVRMLDSLLSEQRVEDDSAVVVLLHIATVAPTYLDRGKSVVVIDGELEQAVEDAIVAVTKQYAQDRKAAERDAAREMRRRQQRSRNKPKTSLKDAIALVLPEAILNASGGGVCDFNDRDLYYAARELIQKYTDAALTQKYFDKVVDAWEEDNGLIEGRLRDPRGYLLEPHTGKKIPLGTKDVEEYELPLYLYDTILYFEKKGMESKCAWGMIPERYDCAIMACEGYAVRAAKALIEAAQKGHKMKVLCFHDGDPDGKNIARTLSQATGAHRYSIEVIDAGLNLEEALDMGLAVEKFTRKKALPDELELTDLEREYFTGEPKEVLTNSGNYKTHWVNCRRVELNALSADPQRFVEWVESKLQEHGVAKKLVPPKKHIAATTRHARDKVLRDTIRGAIEERLDIPGKVEQLAKRLKGQVEIGDAANVVNAWGDELIPEPWTDCVDRLVCDAVSSIDNDVDREVEAVLASINWDGGQPS